MRAARRLIVLAGILATVVFAPVTWSQAGAQTEGDGETPTATFTFVKFVCADFGLIPANAFESDGLRARPDGTTLGPPIAAGRVDPNESGSGCERVPDWPFVLGGPDDVIPNPPSPGNMVDPSMPPLTGTVALTSEQIRLLDNGDLKASEVQQPGFAFGTLRCGTDNRNDDNLEFLGLTENDSLACVAYNVAAPVTISKIVEGSTPKGPFALTVTCGDGESTSYQNDLTLDDGGSQRLWLPYDTELHSCRDRDGRGRRDVVLRERRGCRGEPRERGRPDSRLHHAWHRGQRSRRDGDRRDQHRRVGRRVADEDRDPGHASRRARRSRSSSR